MDLIFTIPGLPPSINAYWKSKRGLSRPYISEEGKSYQRFIALHFRKEMNSRGLFMASYPGEWALGVDIKLYSPRFWTKPKKKSDATRPSLTGGDIDNFVKILLDCSSKAMSFNDAQIMKQTVEKIDSEKEETHLRIWRAA